MLRGCQQVPGSRQKCFCALIMRGDQLRLSGWRRLALRFQERGDAVVYSAACALRGAEVIGDAPVQFTPPLKRQAVIKDVPDQRLVELIPRVDAALAHVENLGGDQTAQVSAETDRIDLTA